MGTTTTTEVFDALLEEAAKLSPALLLLLRSRIDSMISAQGAETRPQAVAGVRAEDEAVVDAMAGLAAK